MDDDCLPFPRGKVWVSLGDGRGGELIDLDPCRRFFGSRDPSLSLAFDRHPDWRWIEHVSNCYREHDEESGKIIVHSDIYSHVVDDLVRVGYEIRRANPHADLPPELKYSLDPRSGFR